MDDSTHIGRYEAPIELDTIFKKAQRERIQESLRAILQQPVVIQSTPIEGYVCEVIDYEFEPIAYVCVPYESSLLSIVTELVKAILFERIRYHLAENLHVETIQRDFESLQERHTALAASELRYRELAAQLEQRVEEQVKVIDARQRQLYQAERMRAVGQLAAGMAHEINNPLGFIGSNLCTAKEYVQEISEWFDAELDNTQRALLEDFSSLLEEARGGVSHVAVVIRDLRTFSNIDNSETIVIPVGSLIDSTLNMIRALCPVNIVVDTQLNALPSITCQPAQLAQAFFNLLQNAIESMPNGGRLGITTFFSHDELCVSIQDTGVGMNAEQIAQACNPFYTTKQVGAGLGLGLTVAHEIAKHHKGKLEFISTPGSGTEVIFHLPISTSAI